MQMRPRTPVDQAVEEHLQADLAASGRLGTALEIQSTPFRIAAEELAGAVVTGPRRYMVRLRRIEQGSERLLEDARAAWLALAARHAADPVRFARAWRAWVAEVDTTALNALIDAHNRYYPIEANLPMDIRTRDYVTYDGRDFRWSPVDAAWLLARHPADLAQAVASSQ